MALQHVRRIYLLVAMLVALVSYAAQASTDNADFTIVALPDTQMYSQNHPQIFRSVAEWIAANAQELNIKMVLHEGDVVNKGANDLAQWPNAKTALDIIDKAGIPMFIAMGNHDYDDMAKTRSSSTFNRFFGISRYNGRPWFGGVFTEGKAENIYGFVSAGGREYLVFALEFSPRQGVVDWANQVIAQYPQHDVVIVTHNYLFSDGTQHNRLVQGGTYGISSDANNGLQLWEKLVNTNKNVVLVLSGHVGGDGVAQRTDITAGGNMVHQLETNYQFNPMGGEGYIRLMRFRPSTGVIEVTTYSPYLNKYLTDVDNQFTLPYNPSNQVAPFVTISGKVSNHINQGDAMLVSLQQAGKTLNANYTDTNGNFSFRVLPGNYTVNVKAGSYSQGGVDVAATQPGKEYDLPITLQPTEPAASAVQPTANVPYVWAGTGVELPGKLAEGTKSDIVMRNNKLAMVIAATFNDPQLPQATLGKPIDMAATGLNDGIDWMNFPYLSMKQPIWNNSGSITTVQNKSVHVTTITNEEAVVEAEGIYTEVAGITVHTRYSLRPNEEWVYAVSTIKNTTNQDITLWAGDVMDDDDGNEYVYVPGVGDIKPGTKGRSEYKPTALWVGHYGDSDQGYAFVYDDSFAGFINFGANITVMTQRQVTIPAGGSFAIRRYIVVAPSAGRLHKMDAVAEVYEKIQGLD